MEHEVRTSGVQTPRVARSFRTYLSDQTTVLPSQWDIEEAIQEITRLHQANGGATFNLYFGNQAGLHLYSVSVFPDRTYRTKRQDLSGETLREFMEANRDLLNEPGCCIGTWYNEDTQFTYLDISVIAPNKQEALSLSKSYNQVGMFDLFRMEFIPTGGTGEPIQNMPPVQNRLPAYTRKREDHE